MPMLPSGHKRGSKSKRKGRTTFFDKAGGPYRSKGSGFSLPSSKTFGKHWGALSGNTAGRYKRGKR